MPVGLSSRFQKAQCPAELKRRPPILQTAVFESPSIVAQLITQYSLPCDEAARRVHSTGLVRPDSIHSGRRRMADHVELRQARAPALRRQECRLPHLLISIPEIQTVSPGS